MLYQAFARPEKKNTYFTRPPLKQKEEELLLQASFQRLPEASQRLPETPRICQRLLEVPELSEALDLIDFLLILQLKIIIWCSIWPGPDFIDFQTNSY